jgi:hypothetical protein
MAVMTTGSVTYAGPLKADPAPISPFIQHRAAMVRNSKLPFNRVAINPSQRAWERVRGFDKIVILPVNTKYLRPYHSPFANNKLPPVGERRPVGETTRYIQTQFEQAFAKDGKFHVVSKPQRGALSLEIALVDLRPSNVAVNLIGTAASSVAPGANLLSSQFSRGSIAIEGKLRNAETGELLAEFSDREHDKTSLFSFRDYAPYAHDHRAISDWAKEVEQMVRLQGARKVNGAAAFTLNPF